MKVMKTLKSFKFWSKKKKKKKKKLNADHHSPPPCCCSHHHHHHHYNVLPSAPPLPSWLDYEEQTYNHHLLAYEVKFSSNEAQFDPSQEDEITIAKPDPDMLSGEVETTGSYQQYMVQSPVFGVPVLPPVKSDRSAGAVGCVFGIGAHLFRCFFPCFHIGHV